MIADAILFVAILVALYSQYQTRKRVRVLQEALVEMGPALEDFSNAVDRTEDSFAAMRTGAEEVATRIQKQASDAEKRVRLMNSLRDTKTSKRVLGGSSLFSDKTNMIHDFFDMAKTRS